MSDFGYPCEWCEGTVQKKQLNREMFRHARGFAILESVTVGVCDKCGRKYYDAATLRRVEEIVLHSEKAERTETVPVAHV
jgi:YgiT-type zinc finger domain-containing protein